MHISEELGLLAKELAEKLEGKSYTKDDLVSASICYGRATKFRKKVTDGTYAPMDFPFGDALWQPSTEKQNLLLSCAYLTLAVYKFADNLK